MQYHESGQSQPKIILSHCSGLYLCLPYMLVPSIRTDTVLKLGAQTHARSAEKIFQRAPKFALCPQIPGAQRGHTTVENNTSLKKNNALLTWRHGRSQPRRSGGAPLHQHLAGGHRVGANKI